MAPRERQNPLEEVPETGGVHSAGAIAVRCAGAVPGAVQRPVAPHGVVAREHDVERPEPATPRPRRVRGALPHREAGPPRAAVHAHRERARLLRRRRGRAQREGLRAILEAARGSFVGAHRVRLDLFLPGYEHRSGAHNQRARQPVPPARRRRRAAAARPAGRSPSLPSSLAGPALTRTHLDRPCSRARRRRWRQRARRVCEDERERLDRLAEPCARRRRRARRRVDSTRENIRLVTIVPHRKAKDTRVTGAGIQRWKSGPVTRGGVGDGPISSASTPPYTGAGGVSSAHQAPVTTQPSPTSPACARPRLSAARQPLRRARPRHNRRSARSAPQRLERSGAALDAPRGEGARAHRAVARLPQRG
jgi:hypothetical protein